MFTASGLILPARPAIVAGPHSVFREDATKLARAAQALSEERVGKFANQMYYGRADQTGKFYGYEGLGYGGAPEGGYPFIACKSFSVPIWVVPPTQPRVKVWLVNEEISGPEETLQTGEFAEQLQQQFDAVALPSLKRVPKGRLQALGTDGVLVVICGDEIWEMHRFGVFKEGPHAGEYKLGFGCFVSSLSSWNGICPATGGQVSASHLSYSSGAITSADLLKVARGGKIEHAIQVTMKVLLNEHVAPAQKNDHQLNESEFLEDGITRNPAYWTEGPEGLGSFDALPEGSWFAYPAESHASEFPLLTRSLEQAIYEAGREHGFVVTDKGGGPGINIADLRTLYTPYDLAGVNALAGSTYFAKYINGEEPGETPIPTSKRTAWTDPTLTTFTGQLNGTTGILWNQPWRTLQLLTPRPG